MSDPPPLGKGSGPAAPARSRRLRSTQIHEIVRLTSALRVTGASAVEAHGVMVHFNEATPTLPDAGQAAQQQQGSHQAARQLSKRAEKRRERSRKRATERARAPESAVPFHTSECGQKLHEQQLQQQQQQQQQLPQERQHMEISSRDSTALVPAESDSTGLEPDARAAPELQQLQQQTPPRESVMTRVPLPPDIDPYLVVGSYHDGTVHVQAKDASQALIDAYMRNMVASKRQHPTTPPSGGPRAKRAIQPVDG